MALKNLRTWLHLLLFVNVREYTYLKEANAGFEQTLNKKNRELKQLQEILDEHRANEKKLYDYNTILEADNKEKDRQIKLLQAEALAKENDDRRMVERFAIVVKDRDRWKAAHEALVAALEKV